MPGPVSPIISPGNECGVDLAGLGWPHGGVGSHGLVEAPLHWAGVGGNHSLVSTYGQQGYMQVSPPRQSLLLPCVCIFFCYVCADTLAARVTGKQEDSSRRSHNWMHHAETIALMHDQVSVHTHTHTRARAHTHTYTHTHVAYACAFTDTNLRAHGSLCCASISCTNTGLKPSLVLSLSCLCLLRQAVLILLMCRCFPCLCSSC